jgi:hypothetical protein
MRCGPRGNEEWVPNEGGTMAEHVGTADVQACGAAWFFGVALPVSDGNLNSTCKVGLSQIAKPARKL